MRVSFESDTFVGRAGDHTRGGWMIQNKFIDLDLETQQRWSQPATEGIIDFLRLASICRPSLLPCSIFSTEIVDDVLDGDTSAISS